MVQNDMVGFNQFLYLTYITQAQSDISSFVWLYVRLVFLGIVMSSYFVTECIFTSNPLLCNKRKYIYEKLNHVLCFFGLCVMLFWVNIPYIIVANCCGYGYQGVAIDVKTWYCHAQKSLYVPNKICMLGQCWMSSVLRLNSVQNSSHSGYLNSQKNSSCLGVAQTISRPTIWVWPKQLEKFVLIKEKLGVII